MNFKANSLSSILLQVKWFLALDFTLVTFLNYLLKMCLLFTSQDPPCVDGILPSFLVFPYTPPNSHLLYLIPCGASQGRGPKAHKRIRLYQRTSLIWASWAPNKRINAQPEFFDYSISVLALVIQQHCYMVWASCIILLSIYMNYPRTINTVNKHGVHSFRANSTSWSMGQTIFLFKFLILIGYLAGSFSRASDFWLRSKRFLIEGL